MAREVIDAILAKNKHDVVVLTRKDITEPITGVTFIKVDYTDKASLVKAVRDADVVLSFIVIHLDPENVAQKNLIDAAVEVGVKRFAPSEWALKSGSGVPFYAGKDQIREYLEEINKDKKVLEYTLFQPGLFLDYFAHPYADTRHLNTTAMQLDFQHRRGIQVDDGQHPVVLTLVRDLAAVVAEAIDYAGEWPVVGGIRGSPTTFAEILKLGEELRGPFKTDTVSADDIKNGVLNTTWVPTINHPSIPPEQREEMSKLLLQGFLKAAVLGKGDVSDEWNRLLPEYKFTGAEEYLRKVWEGKP